MENVGILNQVRRMKFLRTTNVILILTFFLSACANTATPDATKKPVGQVAATATSSLPLSSGCTIQSRKTVPNPTVQSLLPAVTKEDWVVGPEDAKITILEYSDFQCPGCSALEPALKALKNQYSSDVRIAYRHFPLTSHDKSQPAAVAAEAAGAQGKFWEMHDLLFERQAEWTDLGEDQFREWLLARAAELGLAGDQFQNDMQSEAFVEKIKLAAENNLQIGMPGTPFLVINGNPYTGPLDKASLSATIELILLEERQFSECPPMTIEPEKQYFAILHTEKGDLTLELYARKAQLAVNSFIFLARNGWFDGVTFHRVLPNFVAQAGDPTGTGFGGPGYAFVNEIDPNLRFDKPGVLAMANAGPGSNGSQFFITYKATPQLDGDYTIFGQLVAGMDALLALTPRDPSQGLGLPPGDKIISVEIIEK